MVETQVRPQLFFDNGHQHVHRHGHPSLRLHGALGSAVESLDAQVLFDPAKEQFHLPAGPIQSGDGQSGEKKIVGEESEPHIFLGAEMTDAPQGGGIAFGGTDSGQQNGLVAAQPRGWFDGA